jgi:hypothetical protein
LRSVLRWSAARLVISIGATAACSRWLHLAPAVALGLACGLTMVLGVAYDNAKEAANRERDDASTWSVGAILLFLLLAVGYALRVAVGLFVGFGRVPPAPLLIASSLGGAALGAMFVVQTWVIEVASAPEARPGKGYLKPLRRLAPSLDDRPLTSRGSLRLPWHWLFVAAAMSLGAAAHLVASDRLAGGSALMVEAAIMLPCAVLVTLVTPQAAGGLRAWWPLVAAGALLSGLDAARGELAVLPIVIFGAVTAVYLAFRASSYEDLLAFGRRFEPTRLLTSVRVAAGRLRRRLLKLLVGAHRLADLVATEDVPASRNSALK